MFGRGRILWRTFEKVGKKRVTNGERAKRYRLFGSESIKSGIRSKNEDAAKPQGAFTKEDLAMFCRRDSAVAFKGRNVGRFIIAGAPR